MKLINNRWYDDNNNSWNANIETEESAKAKSGTLINCSYCRDCRDCSDCSDCRDCSDCSYCRDCRDCSDCRDFKENPERIVSNKIGSRLSQTLVYWLNDNIQVVCGCYKGNLKDFKARVQEVHKNKKQYLNEYLTFISKVEKYME